MILLVLFCVCMLFWLIATLAPVPAPYASARSLCAWLSVLFLALIVHVHF